MAVLSKFIDKHHLFQLKNVFQNGVNRDRRPSSIFGLRFPSTHTRILKTETEDPLPSSVSVFQAPTHGSGKLSPKTKDQGQRPIFGFRYLFPKHLHLDLENENRRTHLRSLIFGFRSSIFDLITIFDLRSLFSLVFSIP